MAENSAETEKKATKAKTVKKTATKAKKTKKSAKKTLVIVESPAKAKTIEHYLGTGYTVKASMGHLIDLPKSRIAIDIENNFEPEYITVRGRAKLLKELQKDAKNSDSVLLASDNDREGEAIAWHLRSALEGKVKAPIKRIVFNEITPAIIKEAVKNPVDIDESKVNAQKARRVLDRLVGYNLSPLLWKKVKNGLSAGRVQSVALRLICEREAEVENFIPEEYWSLDADFSKGKSKFSAQLVQYQGKKPTLENENAVKAIIEEIKNADLKIAKRFFNEKEYEYLNSISDSKKQREEFYRLWTMKESYMKFTGLGMKLPLDSFCIEQGEKASCGETVFYEYDGISGYRLSVCSRNKNEKPEISCISFLKG